MINESQAKYSNNLILSYIKDKVDKIEIVGKMRRKFSAVDKLEYVILSSNDFGLFKAISNNKQMNSIGNTLSQSKFNFIYDKDVLIPVILHRARPANFGWLQLAKTGSKEFVKSVKDSLEEKGYKVKRNFVYKDGSNFSVRSEKQVFKMLGVSYVSAINRSKKLEVGKKSTVQLKRAITPQEEEDYFKAFGGSGPLSIDI